MYFLRCLPTFLVYSLCFTLISSAPEPRQVARVNEELLQKQSTPILIMTLIAASTGKHFFEMPKSISEDCVRTANVALKLAAQPSVFETSKSLIPTSVQAVQSLQPNTGSEYAVELLCKSLNDEFKKNAASLPDVEQMKKNVQLPKPTKHYYINIQPSASVTEMMVRDINRLDDPAFLRFSAAEAFLDADSRKARLGAEIVAVPKAIRKLAQQEAFSSIVDSMFEKLLDDYVKKLYSDHTDMQTKFDTDTYLHLKNIDENFLQNTVLKKEYEKIKKQIINELGEAKPIDKH